MRFLLHNGGFGESTDAGPVPGPGSGSDRSLGWTDVCFLGAHKTP